MLNANIVEELLPRPLLVFLCLLLVQLRDPSNKISQGRSVEQKRELVKVFARETAWIMKTEQEKI
ncbi:MAG TPA: hypothetical protein VI278_11570 [Nitrososphaeraceae archaeon]|jgi:hypothetical protein